LVPKSDFYSWFQGGFAAGKEGNGKIEKRRENRK